MSLATRILMLMVALVPILLCCQDGNSNNWAPTDSNTPYNPGCDPDSVAACADDFFVCTQDDANNKDCISREPAVPDGTGTWSCDVVDGTLHCEGSQMPTDAGSWSCWQDGATVICETPAPTFGDDSSSGSWDCSYEDEHVVCVFGDSSGGDADGDGDGDGDGDSGIDDTVPPGDGHTTCEPWVETTVRFGRSEELVSLYTAGETVDCTTVEVDISGYYAFYDDRIAESCQTQLDEVGFLTVTNGCNPSGLPREGNVDDWFVVRDVDNNVSCSADSECGTGMACRESNAGFCCVPADPVYMGTFFLRAGEANELCINHWCSIWDEHGLGDEFITASCAGSINSIHVSLDGSMRICFDPASETGVCPES